MKYIKRELNQVSEALREPRNEDEYKQLYAVQQALSWALEPNGYKRPLVMVTGIQADSEDYPGSPHPLPS